ncbi:FtsB family cell division protein [Consotaella salsifontis]|uniref:Cell division protein FtsB n=1 Tax=Consotaella salsifontis TaxID=1365950 RepID=A0A1T4T009_9HYPH|nr:septum formation initiator family protein [Consotaella salsifontis]SKA33785.1 Cell division protein FtsB [Consotaella salsifontis]
MWTKQKKHGVAGRLIVPAITASFLAYFAMHAQSGQYGLESKHELLRRLADRTAEAQKVHAQRVRLETKVQLLHDGTLDRDMIDEQARRALNYAAPDEIIIMR